MKTSPPFHGPAHGAKAFTLVELIIATAVMVIVLVVIHGVFLGALRLRQRTIDALDVTQPREQALQIIQRDLANLVISTNGVLMGPLQTVNQTNMLPGQIGPDFYTSGGELDGMTPWGNVEKIDYMLTPPTNGLGTVGQDLVRAITHNLLPVSQLPQPEQHEALLGGVQSLTFQYWDGTEWTQAWDTTQQTNLPQAIKVQIFMMANAGARGANQPIELVVPVDTLLSTNISLAIQ